MKKLAALLALLCIVLTVPAARAAEVEMLMLEQPGCVWCARFNKEIAPAWPNTEEGKRAPLRRVDITLPWPEDLKAVTPERFTPTFVLMQNGKEIGRIRGYPGDQFFWYLAGELIGKLAD